MGQYFKCINLGKKEFLEPEGGFKLWEWTANSDECGLITALLMDRWAGDRLVLLGDYDTSKKFKGLYEKMNNDNDNVLDKAKDLFFSDEIQDLMESKETLYLINEDNKVFVKGSFKQISVCLPLLLRQSTGGGGGDIQEDYKSAGIFVGKRLHVGDKSEIKGFKDISASVFKDAFDFYNS